MAVLWIGLGIIATMGCVTVRALEPWLVNRLIRSPSFHRFVEGVHKTGRRVRHGKDPEDMGGTKLESPHSAKGFLEHFREELRDQFRGGPPKK